jgi:hypothetical protein
MGKGAVATCTPPVNKKLGVRTRTQAAAMIMTLGYSVTGDLSNWRGVFSNSRHDADVMESTSCGAAAAVRSRILC